MRIRPLISIMAGFLSLLIGAVHPFDTAYACSGGGGTPLDELIQQSELIISGHFIEHDDTGLNGIMQVEQVVSAEPVNRYLLLTPFDPLRIEQNFQMRTDPPDCTWYPDPFKSSDEMVAFLFRKMDGSYGWNWFLRYTSRDQTFELPLRYQEPDSENLEPTSQFFNLDQLLQYSADQRQQTVQPPQDLLPYPLTSPILLQTRLGQDYLLPVDGRPPVALSFADSRQLQRSPLCKTTACTAYSPDGLDTVHIVPENTVIDSIFYGHLYLYGDGGVFAPSSDTFVLWSKNKLQIFALYYPRLGFDFYNSPRIINEITIDTDTYPDLVWTPDGRKLAYTDRQGLWLWDALTPDLKPRLLISPEGNPLPTARYFSPHGRYLAITQGGHRLTLDVETGATFPDGLVSPDERILLAFDTAAPKFDVSVVWLAPAGRQQSVGISRDNLLRQVQWVNQSEFLAVLYRWGGCGDNGVCYPSEWITVRAAAGGGSSLRPVVLGVDTPGIQFDYDAASGNLVTLMNQSTIAINGENRDLSTTLKESIVAVHWLPSLIYHRLNDQ